MDNEKQIRAITTLQTDNQKQMRATTTIQAGKPKQIPASATPQMNNQKQSKAILKTHLLLIVQYVSPIDDPQSFSPMSVIGGDGRDRISIHFFETRRQLTEDLLATIRHSESILILGEYLQLEGPELSAGHVLGTIARTCEDS
jgi:hypothetical protein